MRELLDEQVLVNVVDLVERGIGFGIVAVDELEEA